MHAYIFFLFFTKRVFGCKKLKRKMYGYNIHQILLLLKGKFEQSLQQTQIEKKAQKLCSPQLFRSS